eukprot:TRINITY_DN54385_c0_g2_i1.p1 TRINITY_DN54385_c0_g2~~TRINITY_DN54385_c0_g2_i1.p1  ORF type:complete len:110 (+),score=12.79 TRINITY_DN54385_c0_g2_i1:23-331(+)
MSQIDVVFNQRSIFYRQRDTGFFHTSSFVISGILVQVLVSVGEAVSMGTIVYWLTNMAQSIPTFIRFLFIIFLLSICVTGLFLLIGAVSKSAIVAQAAACEF